MRVDPLMDAQAKKALDATKTLHKRLREWEYKSTHAEFNDGLDYAELKKLAADANKAVQAMQRIATDEALRADVRENVLREAVRDELIDREANAARIQDRQRLLLEQAGATETLSAFDRAATSASSVEASIAALCPHQTRVAAGVVVLAAAAAEA
jgi:hypothetical protein